MSLTASLCAKFRRAAVLATTILCSLGVSQARVEAREYAATLIHQFEHDQMAFGPLVGKPGGDLFGIATTDVIDNTPGHMFKISPDGTFTYFDPLLGNFKSFVDEKDWGWGAWWGLTRTSDGSFIGILDRAFSTRYDLPDTENLRGALYKAGPDGTGAIIFRFPSNFRAFPAPHEGADKRLYGITQRHIFNPNTDEANLYSISSSGGGYRVLQTGKGGLSPVLASDGNMYCTMEDDIPNSGAWFERITTEGEVIRVSRILNCRALVASKDGLLYGWVGNKLVQLSTEGVMTEIHTFKTEGRPNELDPFVVGSDGLVYGTCSYEGGAQTIFSITADGKYKPEGIIDGPGFTGPSWYSLTPIAHHVFYEFVNNAIYKLVPSEKHISFNFSGGKAKTDPDKLAATDLAGASPADTWTALTGSHGSQSVIDEFENDGPKITWSAETTGKAKVADDTLNCRMMTGFLETKGKTDITIDVWGMPTDFVESGYDVYVYCNGGADKQTVHGTYAIGKTSVTVSGIQKDLFDSTYVKVDTDTDVKGDNDSDVKGDKAPGNYILFPKLTDRSFTLTVKADIDKEGHGHAVVNGIQIVQHQNHVAAKVSTGNPEIIIVPQRNVPLR